MSILKNIIEIIRLLWLSAVLFILDIFKTDD